MSYEDDPWLDLIFGESHIVAENLISDELLRKVRTDHPVDPDERFDDLPEDFREMLAKAGITKTTLRAAAKQMISKAMEED